MLLKGYDAYYDGYEENGKAVPGYRDLIDELSGEFPLGQPIIGEQKQKDFIKLYGNILRLKNILSAFDQFAGNEILPERDFQDYQSVYLDLYQAYRPKTDGDKENINDDITFEIELIRQVEINIDYILMLVMKYHESNCKDKSILGTIDRAIDSSIQLRSKKDLIHGFINTVNAATDVDRDWQSYVQQQKQQELEQIIAEESPRRRNALLPMHSATVRSKRPARILTRSCRPSPALAAATARKRRKRSSSGLRNFLKNTSGFSGFTPTCIPVHFGVYCK